MPRVRVIVRSSRIAALIALLAPASACVVDSVTPVRSLPSGGPRIPAPSRPVAGTPESALEGAGRITFAFQPMGAVPYDGMTLPLVAPDLRRMAVQVGLAPPWATILAEPGSPPLPGTRVRLFDLTGRRAEPLSIPTTTTGLLLGRSVDDSGFLVEWPRTDGSRWIGRMPWSGAAPQWLVRTSDTSAFAISPGPDWLIYSRRAPDHKRFDLVEQRAGVERVIAADPDASLVFPAVSPDRTLIAAVRVSDKGCQLCLFPAAPAPSAAGGPVPPLDTVALSDSPSMAVAYSVFAASDACPARLDAANPGEQSVLASSIAMFHPGARAAAFVRPGSVPLSSDDAALSLTRWWSGHSCGAIASGPREAFVLDAVMNDKGAINLTRRVTVAMRPLVPCGSIGPMQTVFMVGPRPQSVEPAEFDAALMRIVGLAPPR